MESYSSWPLVGSHSILPQECKHQRPPLYLYKPSTDEQWHQSQMKVYPVRTLSVPEKLQSTNSGKNSHGLSFLTSSVKPTPFTKSKEPFRVMDHLRAEQYRVLIWIIQIRQCSIPLFWGFSPHLTFLIQIKLKNVI